MPPVYFAESDLQEVQAAWLELLKKEALTAPLKRARLCLHRAHRDKTQEMVIAFARGSLVAPHRYINAKSESFHLIEGELLVLMFDDDGRISKRLEMAPAGTGKTFLYRLSAPTWRSVVPMSDFVVVHETISGPFERDEGGYPNWAPPAADEEGLRSFLAAAAGQLVPAS
jgi:glucose-6-phosphate isomerase